MVLDGVRVLDFTRILSGPWCTFLLAHLGAEVIKVEDPQQGDGFRWMGPPYINGTSPLFLLVSSNKKGMTLNLREPDGKDIAQRLAGQVDVLIHNFRADFVNTCGLGYDVLRKSNPGLIYCRISGFGEDGPYADRPGFDFTAQALSGAMSIIGYADRAPVKPMCSYADVLAGYNAVTGILASLHARNSTGKGSKINVNLLDSAIAALIEPYAYYFGTDEPPIRMAPDTQPQLAPTGTFATKDGHIILSVVMNKQWPGLCKALGIPEYIEDARFSHPDQRNANREELRKLMEGIIATKTNSEWIERLSDADVPSAPVHNLFEAEQDPQIQHNRMIFSMEHPALGPIKLLAAPLKIEGSSLPDPQPPPMMGEHTEEVLARYLNMSSDDVARLRKRGVV